ncbi:TAXI family TRAP transporter solute-binding subunit [Cobetia amphilecti]|nr:C4-dicarboxylate ABC transporter substrate-binding protein [Halomonas sp. SF2003]UTV86931.1 TAXI family TRAP transporter solute-binding subunit [Cobetia litoralis]
MKTHAKRASFLAVTLLFATFLSPGFVEAKVYKGETAGAGDSVHTMFVSFVNQARLADVNIQVNAGQTLTKSMLNGARGRVDFFSSVPSLVDMMSKGGGMYQPITNAPELSTHLRAILGFQSGVYHPVTLEGSGITRWEDIAGKTVFTGPPAGSAAATSEALIRGITGYEPGEDYTAVRLSWGEAYEALADGKIDMMIRPAEVGSANIERFGLTDEFRILSIPDSAIASHRLDGLIGQAGRGTTSFDGSLYDGQLTQGKVTALAYYQFIGTNDSMSEDVVYQATKAFWENLASVQSSASFLKAVTPGTAFAGINVPLHPGALRYYREQGYDIPAALKVTQ